MKAEGWRDALHYVVNSLSSHTMQYVSKLHCLFCVSSLHGLTKRTVNERHSAIRCTCSEYTALYHTLLSAVWLLEVKAKCFCCIYKGTLQPIQAHKITGVTIILCFSGTFLIAEF